MSSLLTVSKTLSIAQHICSIPNPHNVTYGLQLSLAQSVNLQKYPPEYVLDSAMTAIVTFFALQS